MVSELEQAAGRVEQIQREMRAAGIDGLVLRLAENVLLATGWFVRNRGLDGVVVPAEGMATLLVGESDVEEAADTWNGGVASLSLHRESDARDFEGVVGEIANDMNLRGGAIGYEGGFESLALPSFFGEPNAVAIPTRELISRSFATEQVVDFSLALEQLRAVKTDWEIERIRRSNEIAMFGLSAFREASKPGATEVEVMAAVEHAIAVKGHGYRGARWVRGYATVCSGPQLAAVGWQFFRSSTRRIERGDAVMVELGTVADGYWSDHTRTVVAGAASATLREADAAVRHAVDAALAAARPGATGGDVDAAARAACGELGLTLHSHHTGHGVGFRYHESLPQLVPGSGHVLRERQVLAIEPGIYGSALPGGVRQEIDAVVTPRGGEILAAPDDAFDLSSPCGAAQTRSSWFGLTTASI